MEKKDNRGGARAGSGRKSKAEELGLVGKLDEIIDNTKVIKVLQEEILTGKQRLKAIEIYLHYYYGKPTKEINMVSDINLQGIDINKTFKFKE